MKDFRREIFKNLVSKTLMEKKATQNTSKSKASRIEEK